jgi:Lactoylglutathione lyase and related lyases
VRERSSQLPSSRRPGSQRDFICPITDLWPGKTSGLLVIGSQATPSTNGASFNFPQGRFQDDLPIPRASAAIIPAMAAHPFPSPNQILRIHCVKVFVRDQDQSLRFYVDQLGFRLVADTVLQSGERWLAVAPPDGDSVLALVAPKPDSKLSQLVGRPTDVVFVTDDVLARYQEWSGRGVKFLSTPKLRRVKSVCGTSIPPGIEAPVWGGVFTQFKDLDGNSFSLVSFDEVTQSIEAQRRVAQNETKPSAVLPRSSTSQSKCNLDSFLKICPF